MAPKTRVVDHIGERALVLPALLTAALDANEQAKYVMTLLQLAAAQAENPQTPPPSLRTEREACGIADRQLDRSIALAEHDGRGTYHIPGARRLIALLDEALRAMILPLEGAAAPGGAPAARYQERLAALIAARPPIEEDMIDAATIASLTSARPKAGDGFHLLVMDLHKEIDRLQA